MRGACLPGGRGAVLAIVRRRLGPAFFPPAGVTVAAMLLSPRSRWAVVIVAIVVAELTVDLHYGVGVRAASGFALANSVEPVVGASLVLVWCNGAPDLRARGDLARFVAGACLAGPLVGGLIGGAVSAASNGTSWPTAVVHWWAGDGIGALVVGAPILLWAKQSHLLRARLAETVAGARSHGDAVDSGVMVASAAVIAAAAGDGVGGVPARCNRCRACRWRCWPSPSTT